MAEDLVMKHAITSLILYLTFLSHASMAQTHEPNVEVLARIKSVGHSLEVIRSLEGDAIPSLLNDKNLEKTLAEMTPGEEAIVRGYISQNLTSEIEGHAISRPVFVIQEIKPISFNRLRPVIGQDNEQPHPMALSFKTYAPFSLPLSTQVTSTLIMTTSLLLMQSLTAPESQPSGQKGLNSGVIVFAGLMQAGVFLYEQIRHPSTESE
jgi:hypothetical protein